MSQPLRLVIFDVDGTLVDSQHHIHAAMALAFETIGQPAPALEQVRGIIGLSLPVAMQHLRPELGEAEITALVGDYKAAIISGRAAGGALKSAPLYAGITDLLDALALQDDLLLGVATGKSMRGLIKMLATHGLQDRFVTKQVADNHPSKPHPSMLKAALSETGVEAGNAVMIGDTTYDIEMGVAAGMCAIGVSWGYHTVDRLLGAGAAHIATDASDLKGLLGRIWD